MFLFTYNFTTRFIRIGGGDVKPHVHNILSRALSVIQRPYQTISSIFPAHFYRRITHKERLRFHHEEHAYFLRVYRDVIKEYTPLRYLKCGVVKRSL